MSLMTLDTKKNSGMMMHECENFVTDITHPGKRFLVIHLKEEGKTVAANANVDADAGEESDGDKEGEENEGREEEKVIFITDFSTFQI